ncbi:DUF6197 family protein [Streptomyces sp. NPDC055607]
MTTSPSLAAQAAEQLGRYPGTWHGRSGHQVTGEAVAQHLEAAAHLMRRENWDPQLYGPFSGRHLRDALDSVIEDGQGDGDTKDAARRVMEELLRLVMGAPYVYYGAWSEHASRTLREVLALCETAAAFARVHGPQQPATPPLSLR